jgi:hypothetical protein
MLGAGVTTALALVRLWGEAWECRSHPRGVAFAYAGTSLWGMDCNVAWSFISVHRLLWLPVTVLTRVVAAIPRRNTASEPCLTAVPSGGARRLRPGRRSAQARCNSCDAPGGGVSPWWSLQGRNAPGSSCRFRGGVRDTWLVSRRWLRPWMPSPERCDRLPVTVAGNLSVGRKQALACRRRSRRPLPKRKASLDGGAQAPSHVGAEHRLQARFRISLVKGTNCSQATSSGMESSASSSVG